MDNLDKKNICVALVGLGFFIGIGMTIFSEIHSLNYYYGIIIILYAEISLITISIMEILGDRKKKILKGVKK